MKNLENYGVQELNAMEIKNVDGGLFGELIDGMISDAIDTTISFVGGVISYALDISYQTYNPSGNGCLE